jgi:hypothetical protein
MRKDVAVQRIRCVHLGVVVRRHRTHDGRQLRHRVGIVAEPLEEVQHALVQHRVTADRFFECRELVARWQFAVEQQPAHFHETGVLGELLDGVAPVHENALFSVDERDVRLAAARRNEPRVVGKDPVFLVKATYVDNVRARGSLVSREFEFFAVRADQAIGVLAHMRPLCSSMQTRRA